MLCHRRFGFDASEKTHSTGRRAIAMHFVRRTADRPSLLKHKSVCSVSSVARSMICVFCYAIVHMLARRGKTRSRKPREGHVSPNGWWRSDTRWQISWLFFTFAITNISNFPTIKRYAIYKYLFNEFWRIVVKEERDRTLVGSVGRALNNLERNRRILVRGSPLDSR